MTKRTRPAYKNSKASRKHYGHDPYHPSAPGGPDIDPAQAPYLDPTAELPGWPGYRTRPGRYGLDYIDTACELAHMEGVWVRQLLTGRFRTRNPVYQLIMGVVGFACSAIFWAHLLALFNGSYPPISLSALIGSAILSLPGLVVLWNLALSLWGGKGK